MSKRKNRRQIDKVKVLAWIFITLANICAIGILWSLAIGDSNQIDCVSGTVYETPNFVLLYNLTEPTEPPTEPETEPPTETPTEPEPTLPPIPEGYENVHFIRDYLRDKGYNDHVIAGIIGNMMAETGGGTLNIKAEIYDNSGYFYGICQWNRSGHGNAHGRDLEGQLDYLMETIEREFKVFGPAFRTSYSEFCNLQDERRAALMFARVYERCAEWSHAPRQGYASKAYEYFMNYDNGC